MEKTLQNSNDLATKLSKYAASAGVLTLIGYSASGQIVHSGTQNLELNSPDDYLEIDLDGDLINDFGFYMYGYTYGYTSGYYYISGKFGYGVIMNPKTDGYDNSWITRMFSGTYTTYSGSVVYYSLSLVNGLEEGEGIHNEVDSWSNLTYPMWPGALGVASIYYYYYGSATYGSYYSLTGDFIGETKFIGIRFYIGEDQHYGWIRLSMGDLLDPMTIIDWAYESEAGRGILAGDLEGDDIAPVVTISGESATTTSATTTLTITVSEPSRGLELEDILVTNGTASNLVEITEGTVYEVDILATDFGNVNVEVAAGGLTDLVGNENAGTSVGWEYIDSSLDLELSGENGISVYPNPVSSKLFVELAAESDIELINSNGRIVYKQERIQIHSIDVNGFSPGLYILRVKNNQDIQHERVIIE